LGLLAEREAHQITKLREELGLLRHATGAPQRLQIKISSFVLIRLIREIRGTFTLSFMPAIDLKSRNQYRTTDRTDNTDTLGLMAGSAVRQFAMCI
jgi:hypothetical protein